MENETNNITDLVSFRLMHLPQTYVINVTAMVSTRSPVEQLIIDTLVCAKEMGAKGVNMIQFDVKPDVLLSLSFLHIDQHCFCIYNFIYHEIPENKFWYFIC